MKPIFLLLISCCFFLCTPFVGATDLRGRVDAINTYAPAPFPMAQASVELKRQEHMQPVVGKYRTGRDGMYYFQNIPPGSYLLVINNSLTIPLQVNNTSFQDINPVLFRY